MRFRHVLRFYDWFPLRCAHTHMGSDPCAVIINLDDALCNPDIDILAYQVKRHGVLIDPVRDQVVCPHFIWDGGRWS